jgi:serine/threonine-protein kinase
MGFDPGVYIEYVDNPHDPDAPTVKLLDWGIAKMLDREVHFTSEGQLVGTPQYLAPEQARGAQVTPQTDVYSLGVMTYELFMEQLPFEAETAAEVMTMHLRVPPPRPSAVWPDIPASLEQLILAMLAKHPERRPTMLEVVARLTAISHELELQRPAELAGAGLAMGSCPPTLAMPGVPEPVPWRYQPTKRWQFLLGAGALIASTLIFIANHDDAAPRAGFRPAHAEAAAPVHPHPVATVAPAVHVAPATPPAPARPAAQATTRPRAESRASSRKLSTEPRRARAPIDPDGTMDPYP